jgi:hypothetical protein
VVLLQGGEQKQRYCTDTDDVFRQVGHTRVRGIDLVLPERGLSVGAIDLIVLAMHGGLED